MTARFVPGARATSPPAADDRCVVVSGRRLLVHGSDAFPRVGDVTALVGTDPDWAVLGALDGTVVWACGLPARVRGGSAVSEPAGPAPSGDAGPAGGPGSAAEAGTWHGWAAVAGELGEPLAALAGRALQVVTWRRTHRFCGQCAATLDDVPGEHARRCPACELYVPMQLSPAVLVALRRRAGTELLLVRHSYGPTELWALVAGFVEAGESLEEAAHREVGEEVGLPLRDVAYFGSQPWAMSGPGVVLAGFLAHCADDDAEPVVDGREIAEAGWFPVDALPDPLPPPFSISRWLIDATRAA